MFLPVFAKAGIVGNLNVLWINLDVYDANADKIIPKIIETGCPEMRNELILYIKKRPQQLTNELVSKAFLKDDAVALSKLKRALVTFRDENIPGPKGDQIKGLDGVLVYTSKPYPQLMTLTTPRRRDENIVAIKVKMPFNPQDFQEQFCSMLPDLTRRP